MFLKSTLFSIAFFGLMISCDFIFNGTDIISYNCINEAQANFYESQIQTSSDGGLFTFGIITVFFTPPLPYLQAAAFCKKNKAVLANITEENFQLFTTFLRGVKISPAYIGSFDGDNYNNAGIALYAASQFGFGAIAVPAGAPLLPLPGLCVVVN